MSDPLQVTRDLARAHLERTDLWCFVGREDGSAVGRFHFRCTDVAALRAELAARPDFTAPGPRGGRWESSERAWGLSLHLKHFDGWPDDRLQAHVDRYGAWLPGAWRWVLPVQAFQWARHWVARESYRDVDRLRGLSPGR